MLPQPWSQRAMLTSNDYKELAARCTELASESSEPTVAEALRALASDYLARAAKLHFVFLEPRHEAARHEHCRRRQTNGTITNPNPASRGARGLAPIPVHRLKAPLRRGIFPTNHSGYDARTWSHAFLFSPYGTGSRRHLNERFSAPEVLKPIRSRRLNRLREERCHPPWQQRTNLWR